MNVAWQSFRAVALTAGLPVAVPAVPQRTTSLLSLRHFCTGGPLAPPQPNLIRDFAIIGTAQQSMFQL